MRTAWAALPLAVVAFGLAACGDDDGGDSGSGGSYPEAVRDNFMTACKASGGDEERCSCALDKIEDRVSYADFKRVDAEIRAGKEASGETADVISDAIKECR